MITNNKLTSATGMTYTLLNSLQPRYNPVRSRPRQNPVAAQLDQNPVITPQGPTNNAHNFIRIRQVLP